MLIALLIWQTYIAAGMCYTLWLANYIYQEHSITLEQYVLEAIDALDSDFVNLVQSRPQWIWKVPVSTVTVLFWPLAMASKLHDIKNIDQ